MLPALEPYLSYWRTTVSRDREIVEAVVRPEHRGPSDGLSQILRQWPGVHYWASGADTGRLVLVRALTAPQRERWWLHALLFLITFLTVQLAGAQLLGVLIHTGPPLDRTVPLEALRSWFDSSLAGMPFAMSLMAILLSHEMGHYLAAKRYGINVSPPYFLPAPIEINIIGTFGAFLRLRSPVVDRRQLLDVGAAGPWLGFLVATLFLIVGFRQSYLVPPGTFEYPMLIEMGHTNVHLGDSLLTWWLRGLVMGEGQAVLNPLAAAGCVGMLVTALNLLPLGQLDGGHILYAVLGSRQRYAGQATLILLLVLGFWYPWWWLWAALVLMVGGGRLSHPRVLEALRPLPASRVYLGLLSIVLFALTFAPKPITLLIP